MMETKQQDVDNVSLVEMNAQNSSSSSKSTFFTTSTNFEETDNGHGVKRSNSSVGPDDMVDYVYRTPNVNFSFWQFIIEFSVHVFFPFSFLYYPVTHKWLPISLNPAGLYFNYIAPMSFWIMIGMALSSSDVGISEAMLPIMFCLNHRLMVSLKYASLTPNEYNHMLSLSDPKTVNQAHQQIQIFDSWHGALRFHVFEFEIMSAAIIVGAKLDEFYFTLPQSSDKFDLPSKNIRKFGYDHLDQLFSVTPYQLWSNYLVKNLKDHTYESFLTQDGSVSNRSATGCPISLPLTEFIRSLLEFGRKHTAKPIMLYNSAICLYSAVVTFLPLLFRIEDAVSVDPYGNAYYAFATIVCFPFSMVNFMFLKFIIMDVLERKTIASALSRIIRAESMNLCDDLWLQDMPTIDISLENNLHSWMYARLMMMKFGQRREFRRDIYMSAFLIILGILTAKIIASFSNIESSSKATAALLDPVNVQTILVIVITFFMIEYFIYASAITNEEYRSHEEILMLNLINFEAQLANKRIASNSEDLSKLETLVESIDKTIDKISRSNESSSLKILGFDASLTVVWTVASTLGASLFFIAAVIYDKMTGNPIFGNT